MEEGTEHLSVYQLTIEDGTKFATLAARGDIVMPDEDTQAALYEATQEVLEAAGRPTKFPTTPVPARNPAIT